MLKRVLMFIGKVVHKFLREEGELHFFSSIRRQNAENFVISWI